ncbi:MAG: von Willebrand factor type A domain-containing protein [Bacteroidales bacterium]|nr:von Willebrand factor type A domain-containing protein [Bacteroidales bacterium]
MNKLMFYTLVCACAFQFVSCSEDENSADGFSPVSLENRSTTFSEKVEVPSGDKFEEFSDNPFVSAHEQKSSTFSVDADGASYCVMRRYLSTGYKVNKQSVRIEEFLNYFTFDYPEPTDGNSVKINGEMGVCPWNGEHYLLRLGVKGKSVETLPLSNLVFLVDVSGSMYSDDKLPLLKKCLKTLASKLNPKDRISIITYSGEVKRLLESTEAKNYEKISSAIDKLTAEGCTNGGFALKMAYEEALNNFIKDGNNRIILGTDGDFNVGVTSTDELLKMVEGYADKGIYLTACGFGSGNLNDAMMEAVSNRGNGTYEYIDSEAQMLKVFLYERSKFYSVASDAKCQVTFNPEYVDSYRLIGYENRVMSNEDFNNDKKDAGEIGAGQTVTALYEVVPVKGVEFSGKENIAVFDFRYKKALNTESIPLSYTIGLDGDNAESENFMFAASVAAYGMLLRESEYKGNADYNMVKELVSKSLSFDPQGYRAEFLELVTKAGKN